jgi:hypothetical protein
VPSSKNFLLWFYTGKEELNENDIEIFTNSNICIILGRPTLAQLIPNLIYGIESGKGRPERYVPTFKQEASEMLVDYLDDDMTVHSEKLVNLSNMAAERGFRLAKDDIEPNHMKIGRHHEPGSRSQHRRRQSAPIMEHLDLGFKPWEQHVEASDHVKKLCTKHILATWGMLYFGGAKVMEYELKKISMSTMSTCISSLLGGDVFFVPCPLAVHLMACPYFCEGNVDSITDKRIAKVTIKNNCQKKRKSIVGNLFQMELSSANRAQCTSITTTYSTAFYRSVLSVITVRRQPHL